LRNSKPWVLMSHVTVHGVNWNEADALARQWVDEQQQPSSSSLNGNTTVLPPRRR
jgi:hypothetical protein